ncbi:GT2 family glycosyltransferase/2-polyprenyl-3-methyl-5-hydroxy-6-metoxy-1,4-benzoquinol methylase [Chitinivorax tropicus]|uniref:GT2 family glycosyltransferase/2-polyprenyl-3-methyl-5-hydroxy-6-metoxy-1,4-benzoquinol methylase n=1 Tax=Chitinivorax tropicus TaxID=714531 RepID=A0A840MC11_9PROT|nr:glycosyltransferase [Chitinivorax tropicus]MBB5016864.1 GT2 family glycosyltransferase/2-polyprenyl-3-methyl-5-hydroxy-6-metoxy-1,4-benzoquinol methylase [Chitinivorax tropicus]
MKQQALVCFLWEKNIDVLRRHLQRFPDSVVLVYAPCTGQPSVAMQELVGSRLVDMGQLLTQADLPELQHALAHYEQQVETLGQSGAWLALCESLSLAATALTEAVIESARGHAAVGIQLLAALDKANHLFDIRLLLLNEDVTAAGRITVAWGKAHGVPSLLVQHGVQLSTAYTVHGTLFADVAAVFGGRGIEAYLDVGVAPERMFITGNPAWDAYPAWIEQRDSLRKQLCEKHGQDVDRPIVLFGTTWAANLSAMVDEAIYGETLRAFIRALPPLMAGGLRPQFVIKDRAANAHFGVERYQQIALEEGVDPAWLTYTTLDTEAWVVASDVVVAVDSNLTVEAMIAGTPAINLMNETGMLLGPSFDAETGVLEVEADELMQALAEVLTSESLRLGLRQQMAARLPHYNHRSEQCAAERVVELIARLGQFHAGEQRFVWQQYLDVEEIDATGYHEGARGDLVAMFTNTPQFVLDIGCAAGGTGRVLKQMYPQAKVWGIETNRAAAQVASTRLDKVLVGKFEEFDLEAEGIPKGSLDGVIVADVLEHMYNPWQVMETLRPYLSPTAQVIASIPNVRNLALMDDLAKGHWKYEALGLLDITHIRFFTYKEVERFFRETGYRLVRTTYGIDTRLKDVFEQHRDHCPTTLDTGKMVLRDVSHAELCELCSLQFYVVAVPSEAADSQPLALDAGQLPALRHQQLLKQHVLTVAEAEQFELRLEQWDHHPLFHVVVIVTPNTVEQLGQTIQSLAQQGYYRVRITILSGSSAPVDFVANEHIEWMQADGLVFDAINQLFAHSDADWLLALNAGDTVVSHSMLFVAEQAFQHPAWQLIYSDEDTIGGNSKPELPYFKPGFSPDYLRGYPYIGSLVWLSKPAFNRLLGFQTELAGAEWYDLQLRALAMFGTDAFGHVADILIHRWPVDRFDDLPTLQIVNANATALQNHLAATQTPAKLELGRVPGSYRLRYQLTDHPLVSIIIPTLDNLDYLRRCIETVLEHTDYPRYELIIIDTGSQEPEAMQYLQGLEALGSESVRVYTLPGPFNFSRLMNLASGEAQGEYLLFLNNDVAPLHDDWLSELMGYAIRPDIGVVGPRLLKPDGTVQQAGLTLGLLGAADTAFFGIPHDSDYGFGRAQLVQNVSAVSGSCLLIRKAVFQQVGGMNEDIALAYTDVDLCLRVRELGLLIVYTPYASLLHEGGATLKNIDLVGNIGPRLEADRKQLHLRWLPQLARDPYYNTNLSLNEYGCQIDTRPSLTWNPLSWKPLPRILAHPGDNQGCGHYRIIQPLSRAVDHGLIEATYSFSYFTPVEMERFEIDTWLLQRQLHPHQTDIIRQYKALHKCLLVFELDDLTTNLPAKSLHREHIPKDIRKWLREAVALCDRFVVSTEPLAEAYRDLSADIRVVKNAIDTRQWGHFQPRRGVSSKPRVGWAGGLSHTGDLEMIAGVVAALADEVDWVFMGMCPDKLRPHVKEFHPGVPIDRYPGALAGLNLDLALAPLEINHFNECKSNLRLLEYGILGFPVIATDIIPYQGDFPIKRVKNRDRDWIQAIREHLSDRQALAARGDALREYVLAHWTIEKHLENWMQAWFR